MIILPVVRLFNDFLWSLAAVLASCVDVPMLIVPIYHSIVGFFFFFTVCPSVCVCVCVGITAAVKSFMYSGFFSLTLYGTMSLQTA